MTFVLCFDFDHTLVNGHFHNALCDMGIKSGNATHEHAQALKDKYGLKNPEFILKLIRDTLENGNHVAIVSFTNFPEIIKPTLKIMGLTDEELDKIYVRGGFPSDGNPSSPLAKTEHLQDVMSHFGIEDKKKGILADDSPRNIARAKSDGYLTVTVPQGSYSRAVWCSFLNKKAPEYIAKIYEYIKPLTVKPFNPLSQTIYDEGSWAALTGAATLSHYISEEEEDLLAVGEKRAHEEEPLIDPFEITTKQKRFRLNSNDEKEENEDNNDLLSGSEGDAVLPLTISYNPVSLREAGTWSFNTVSSTCDETSLHTSNSSLRVSSS